jgi:hypothetical protein
MKRLPIIFILSIIFFSACKQDETCRESKEVFLRVGFFESVTNKAVSIDSLTVFALHQDGSAMDSLLYDNRKNISSVILPLNKVEQASLFVMKLNDLPQDTLSVLYENVEYFISYPCGMIITHTLDTVWSTHHFIKDVNMVHKNINTTNVQHLQVLL